MPLTSPLAIQSALASSTEQVWLMLMDIEYPDIETLHIVNNTIDVDVGAIKYIAYPFNVILAQDDGDQLPKIKLTIDNVDRALVESIRTISESPKIKISLVLSSQPTVSELDISGLVLREVEYDQYSITGTMYSDDLLNSRFPADKITLAGGYLGLFR